MKFKKNLIILLQFVNEQKQNIHYYNKLNKEIINGTKTKKRKKINVKYFIISFIILLQTFINK